MDSRPQFQLNPDLVLMLLQEARSRGEGDTAKLRITKAALSALTELCRLLIVAARARAEAEAYNEGSSSISPENVEIIMAELLADF